MEIVKFEYYTKNQLIENIRNVHLAGRPEEKIYRSAKIYIKKEVNPEDIAISQYYVLEKDLMEISNCRKALLDYGVDIFKLDGFVRVFFREKGKGVLQVFDVLPPVVELSYADGGLPLLCDGLHRLYLARVVAAPINIVMIENYDTRFPYYALPNEGGWNSVIRSHEVPEFKKNYRIKDYKSLFRDFNTAFLNVTQPRTSRVQKNLKVQGEQITPC